jgi:hypothetical protein
MERGWQYVQERSNLIHEMNGNIKDRSKPMVIQTGEYTSQRQKDLSQLLMNPDTIPEYMKPLVNHYPELSSIRPDEPFKEPKVFDENGSVENGSTNICESGVCQYVPKSKYSPKQEQIQWINNTDQATNFQPPSPPSLPQTTSLKALLAS